MSDKLNPIIKFKEWFDLATEKEVNDPNAMCLSTVDDNNSPHSRMVLLKDYSDAGFTFYTNYKSNKGNDILRNTNVCLNFHWKSLLRQIRIEGKVEKVSKEISDQYFNSRHYLSRIGAWASKQSSVLKTRDELFNALENYKNKYKDKDNVPRPKHWTGWNLTPSTIEFWLDGDNRIHERLKYILKNDNTWDKNILSP